MLILSTWFRGRNRGTEWFGKLLEVAQLVGGKAGFGIPLGFTSNIFQKLLTQLSNPQQELSLKIPINRLFLKAFLRE